MNDIEFAPYTPYDRGYAILAKDATNPKVSDLTMDIICPRCQYQTRHSGVVSTLLARKAGIFIKDNGSYPGRKPDLMKKAFALYDDAPSHAPDECFMHLSMRLSQMQSDIDDLNDRLMDE